MRRATVILAVLVAVLCVSGGVFAFAMLQALQEVQRRGQSDLALASDRLVSGLFSYRQLAVALATDPRLAKLPAGNEELTQILQDAADFSGALDFVLLDTEQKVVAAASLGGRLDWRLRNDVTRAFHGALGRDVELSDAFGRRVFYYTAPVFSEGGPVVRAILVVIDLEAIEADFRGSRHAIYVTDEDGIIYFSNRSELVLRDRTIPATLPPRSDSAAAFFDYRARDVAGFAIWSVSAGRYVPRWALHLGQDLPVIGMRAEALIDLRPALAAAGQQAAAVFAVLWLLGTVILVVVRQRRVLSEANQMLEQRVAQRTQELSQANQSLRGEIEERLEAEKALRQAQEDLVQAEKLSALGKMSAGISHELNQPLMAIQSFADNAAIFLERNNTKTAQANLQKISELAHRMGRIIQNFRAFARQERDVVHRVELGAIIRSAADIAELRLAQHQTHLVLELPEQPVWVQGGEVRLQQVVLNLISNAIDAMATSKRREIRVRLLPGLPVVLAVQDTGPGIDEPDKVFEPFYSTKSIGEAEGVGLGLSISYGLVQSFGGNIRGQNGPNGGAVFTVELQPWDEEEEAA